MRGPEAGGPWAAGTLDTVWALMAQAGCVAQSLRLSAQLSEITSNLSDQTLSHCSGNCYDKAVKGDPRNEH